MANLLDNGGFHGNLDEWTGTGSILRSDGYPRYGCAQLDDGEYVEQDQDIGADQLHTLHYFYKISTGGTLTATYGSSLSQAHSGVTVEVWHEGALAFALDANGSDSVRFAASGATCYVDSVTLLVGGLSMTRATVATRVARKIAALATEQSLSTDASTDGPEGDYSDAIDDALRGLGCINVYGDPDVTAARSGQVSSLIDGAVAAMVEQLRVTYSLESDVSLGPRRESRSQIAGMLGELQGGSGGGGKIEVRRLRHP